MNENATARSTVERVAAALHQRDIARFNARHMPAGANDAGRWDEDDDYRAVTAALRSEGIYLVSRDELAGALHGIGGEFCSPFTTPEQEPGWPGGHPVAMHNSQAAAILAALDQPR